jgi:alpha-D-ribose 1-methylphosphonate 5-triphosphate synthase subunit PhnH
MREGLHLAGGFSDPPVQSARAFRACLQAMARPGRVQTVAGVTPPAPLSVAAGTVLLTLTDSTTPLHLAPSHDRPEVRQWIAFHTGAPLVAADEAVFALGTWASLHPVTCFPIGTPDYPDRAATLIVEMAALTLPNARLTGPGIEAEQLACLPEITAFAANRALFPLGFDCFLTSGDRIAGLPRSTKVEAI